MIAKAKRPLRQRNIVNERYARTLVEFMDEQRRDEDRRGQQFLFSRFAVVFGVYGPLAIVAIATQSRQAANISSVIYILGMIFAFMYFFFPGAGALLRGVLDRCWRKLWER